MQAGPLQICTCSYLPPSLLSFPLAKGPRKALVRIRLPPGPERLSGSPSGLQENVGELGWPGRKGVQGPWQAEADVCAHSQLAPPLGLRKGSPSRQMVLLDVVLGSERKSLEQISARKHIEFSQLTLTRLRVLCFLTSFGLDCFLLFRIRGCDLGN